MKVDYLIVGSGLTGALIARSLHDSGREVVVVDRRSHVGGNVHDQDHKSGIRIHTYGPHYFRTSSDKIWDWATRFGDFFKYEARVMSHVRGKFYAWPLNQAIIDEFAVLNTAKSPYPAKNFEQAALSMMPLEIYQLFVKEYNEKQWGCSCDQLEPGLCKRFDVRQGTESRLTPNARYQGIPVDGYHHWMQRVLDGIPVFLGVDFLTERESFRVKKCTIFTGPIDEYFGFDLGKLQYRGQLRNHSYIESDGVIQKAAQINEPLHSAGSHIRSLEWRQMMRSDSNVSGTVITREVPFSPTNPSEYEYPFPSVANSELYKKYRVRANSIDSLVIAGRLGEYRYFDMDQAIGRAMVIADQLIRG